jgi:hypothetical protein
VNCNEAIPYPCAGINVDWSKRTGRLQLVTIPRETSRLARLFLNSPV